MLPLNEVSINGMTISCVLENVTVVVKTLFYCNLILLLALKPSPGGRTDEMNAIVKLRRVIQQ